MAASNQPAVSPVKGPWKLIDVDNDFVATTDVESAVESIQGDTLKVIAIVGTQGGGKSSLLNAAFNAPFVARKGGHERTTCGIDVCVDPDSRLLILDIEGSDSDAREDSGDTERRFMTFALLYCDMVIINVQENSIGRREGFNSSLLSNAFEARLNIGITNKVKKTLLLFALRDSELYDPDGDLSTKKETEAGHLKRVKDRVNTLWNKVEKPESCTSSIDDFFDIIVQVFPNKRDRSSQVTFQSCAEEFGRACKEDSGLISQVYSRKISPAECFVFMRRQHKDVKEWKSGSIPLGDTLQCSQAADRQWRSITKEISALHKRAKKDLEHPFPTAIPKLVEKVHEEYEKDCLGCYAATRDDKKIELMALFLQQLQPLFDDYKLNLSEQLKKQHQMNLEQYSMEKPAEYLSSAKTSREVCINEYCAKASKSANLIGMDPLPYGEEKDELDRSLQSITREAALTWAKSLSREKGKYEEDDLVALRKIFARNAWSFAWKPTLEFYKLTQSNAEESLRQSFREIGIPEEQPTLVLTCSSLLWEELVKQIRDFFEPMTVMKNMNSILSTELERVSNLHAASTNIRQRYIKIVERINNYLETVACIHANDPNLYAIPTNATKRGEDEDEKWSQVVLRPDQVEEIRKMFAQELKRREEKDVHLQNIRMVWEVVSVVALTGLLASGVGVGMLIASELWVASTVVVAGAGQAAAAAVAGQAAAVAGQAAVAAGQVVAGLTPALLGKLVAR